jgi:beta-lactamase regulating signal transducer with metallopeptidase domain
MTPLLWEQSWNFLLDMALKSCLLIMLAGIGLLLLRRSSAATRHLVLLASLSALLALPLLAVVLPRWQWDWQPRVFSEPRSPIPSTSEPKGGEVSFSTVSPYRHQTPASLGHTPDRISIGIEREAGWSGGRLKPLPQKHEVRLRGLETGFRREMLMQGGLLLWLMGASIVFFRLLAGLIAMHSLRRRSETLMQEDVRQLAAEVRREMGVRRAVALLQLRDGDAMRVPIVWGVLRPTILLPVCFLDWSPERLRLILAHLRRGDWLAQTLAETACALYWFNPLVWWAASRLREECERACDDCVLLTGVPPPTYADTLLEVIRTMKESRPVRLSALSMARPPIEKRLRAILTPRTSRKRRLSRPVLLLIWTGAAACALPIAALHVNAMPRLRQPVPVTLTAPTTTSAEAVTVARATPSDEPDEPVTTTKPERLDPLESLEPLESLDPLEEPKKPTLTIAQRAREPRDEIEALRERLEALTQQLVETRRENQELRRQLQRLQTRQKAGNRENERAAKINQELGRQNLQIAQEQQRALENALMDMQKQRELQNLQVRQKEQRVKAGTESQSSLLEAQAALDQITLRLRALQQQLKEMRSGRKVSPQEQERRGVQQRIEELQIELRQAERTFETTQERYKIGQITGSELLEAEQEVLEIKARINQIEAGVR